MAAKVEQCVSAHPLIGLGRTLCNCDVCTAEYRLEISELIQWMRKNMQWALHRQRDVCSCRSDYIEFMDRLSTSLFTDAAAAAGSHD